MAPRAFVCHPAPMDAEQMEFSQVTEMERMPGDTAYTEWVKAGRPQLDADTAMAVLATSPFKRRRTRSKPVETLPGL